MAESAVKTFKHIVLTGPPGIGKTTLVKKVCSMLRKKEVLTRGFYTEENRVEGKRKGFDVVTLDGQRGTLACIAEDAADHRDTKYRVGQYQVSVREFEQLALPVLQPVTDGDARHVYVIDEIGKMELFSEGFTKSINDLLSNSSVTIFATIPVRKQTPIALVERIRQRKDVKLFEINPTNRDHIATDIYDSLLTAFQEQQQLLVRTT